MVQSRRVRGRDGVMPDYALDVLYLVRFYFCLQRCLNVVCPFLSAVPVSHALCAFHL